MIRPCSLAESQLAWKLIDRTLGDGYHQGHEGWTRHLRALRVLHGCPWKLEIGKTWLRVRLPRGDI